MKKLLFIIIPVILAIFAFMLVTFILSQQDKGSGALQVTSVPQSNVYLNDKFIGQTPLCKCDGQNLLPSGDYIIRVVPISGPFTNEPFEQKITIVKSVLTVVDRTFGEGALSQGSIISLLPQTNRDSKIGSLSIISFPSGVTVALDGNQIGQTPLLSSHIVESDHDLVLSKPGYQDKTIRIHTVNNYTLSVIAFLGIDVNALNSTSSAQPAASVSAQPQVAKVKILTTPTGFLRVRSDASFAGAEIGQVTPGQEFDLITESNGWTEIKLTDGKTGWVSSSYVQKE